ncbi:MAG TPA: type VI secretion system tip protein TssI/VgrG [Rhodopila sp.]|nr:type VI secretion system tip protein TssI/VgrG [Rhodopila sp.]
MPTDITRDRALLSMTSPLGADVLIPTAVRAEEALSTPFTCTVDLVSARDHIDPTDLLHQPACVVLTLSECPPRYLHGLVREFASTGALARAMFGYRLEIVPALWFLRQTEDCRIFENKSTKDIIQTILSEHGIRFAFRVGDTPPRPLTVQYNETDLNFIMRLMEEEGWFYLFRHEQASHTLIITESNTSFTKVPDGTVTLRPGSGRMNLSEWHEGRATAHGKVTLADYDPEKPATTLSGETSTTVRTAGSAQRDPFRWPARTVTSDRIQQRTRQRIEAAEAEAALAHGAGFNPGFFAGGRIQVSDQPNAKPREFLLHSVTHEASDGTWCNDPTPPAYANTFCAFPGNLPWRPAQTTPRPRMEGLHSALVIGPDGEEIHTDELGRVKLRFRWDHRKDATASGLWVRVMQAWSGANAGWTFIPRVGTEVGVSFLDGDPDRPIVVGQIHNGEQHPPWPLPDQKTRSGLRTRSTPGGGEQNCSEFWFDDKAGSELVCLHAERDLKVEVENDVTHEITKNRKAIIAQGNDTVTVQQGSRTVDVPMGDHTIKSDQGNITVQTNQGNIAIKTALGAVTIEAMQSITLKVGESTITLDQTGVTIKGIQVQIEGQAMASVKAPLTQIDAEGMLKASGGIMMLN